MARYHQVRGAKGDTLVGRNRKTSYVSEGLAACPDLLNKDIVAKLGLVARTVLKAAQRFAHADPYEAGTQAQRIFRERMRWRNPLRGNIQATYKEEADALAIGGLRNIAESVGGLSFVAEHVAKFWHTTQGYTR